MVGEEGVVDRKKNFCFANQRPRLNLGVGGRGNGRGWVVSWGIVRRPNVDKEGLKLEKATGYERCI